MELKDGQIVKVQGSAAEPYQVKRVGDVISCSCPAWRNQSLPINKRTCKHIRKVCGDDAESARIGGSLTMRAPKTKHKEQAVPPAVLLANKWEPDIDPAGWHMSEKLDGIRALWTGTAFISRLGNKLDAPEWFTRGLGSKKLDGELWMGRRRFQEALSVVRSQGLDKEWEAITFLIFDMPEHGGTFEQRYAAMQKLALPGHCKIVKHTTCVGIKDLKWMLSAVEFAGGEGLMLRKAGSLYEGRRSSTLLKVKSFHDDEAVIIGHTPGKGKHAGKLGAYEVKLKNGKTFNVGTGLKDREREAPLKIGTKITFAYTELTNDGIPRFPTYVGEAYEK